MLIGLIRDDHVPVNRPDLRHSTMTTRKICGFDSAV
jgi:hypothetical protein